MQCKNCRRHVGNDTEEFCSYKCQQEYKDKQSKRSDINAFREDVVNNLENNIKFW